MYQENMKRKEVSSEFHHRRPFEKSAPLRWIVLRLGFSLRRRYLVPPLSKSCSPVTKLSFRAFREFWSDSSKCIRRTWSERRYPLNFTVDTSPPWILSKDANFVPPLSTSCSPVTKLSFRVQKILARFWSDVSGEHEVKGGIPWISSSNSSPS